MFFEVKSLPLSKGLVKYVDNVVMSCLPMVLNKYISYKYCTIPKFQNCIKYMYINGVRIILQLYIRKCL